MWHGPHIGPTGSENHGKRGLGLRRYVAKGNGTWDGKGGRKRQATAPWDWETQSPWSGKPRANHEKPGHGKSGKCPELWDGREVSAGVRVDPEVPGSMA